VIVRTPEQMRDLGARVAGMCQPGDVIVLVGDLGAGKTTFVQGMGRALGVREPITSPTFVISRVHEGERGMRLIHIDAYRIASGHELDDLDLDVELESGIAVVEWGDRHAERLAADRLVISIDALANDDREVQIHAIGGRWARLDLATLENIA